MCEICTHKSSIQVYGQVKNYDPTHTTSLRNSFVKECNRRFARLSREIFDAINKRDFLGLRYNPKKIVGYSQDFTFSTSNDKVEEFMSWLQERIDDNILSVGIAPQYGTGINQAWTNMYIQDSYQRGVMRARYEMDKAGFSVPKLEDTGGISASMSTPFHMDRVGVLFTRVYEDLKGITVDMSNKVRKVLSMGMIDGDGMRVISKNLLSTINGGGDTLAITDKLGRFIPAKRRATMLARTEVIRAHHQGMVQEYKNWNLAGVKVQAEFASAEDNRVCDKCASIHGQIFELDKTINLIPVHPQCRCIILPVNPMNISENVPVIREKLASSKVKASGVKKVKTKLGQPHFKNSKHADEYAKYEKEYIEAFAKLKKEYDLDQLEKLRNGISDGMNDELDIRLSDYLENVYKNIPIETEDKPSTLFQMLYHWQGDTRGYSGNLLRMKAYELEQVEDIGMVFKEQWSVEQIKAELEKIMKRYPNGMSDEAYLRLRAVNQAYMKVIKGFSSTDEIALVRGTGGNTGVSIKKAIKAEEAQKMHRTLFSINDNTLVGYTDSIYKGAEFGVDNGGVTVMEVFNPVDILVHKDLFCGVTKQFYSELEYIVFGKKKLVSINDIWYDINDLSTVKKWVKKYKFFNYQFYNL